MKFFIWDKVIGREKLQETESNGMLVFLDGTVMKDYEKLAELADAVAGVNKNLQEITYSSENMSTETKGVLQSIGKLQQNMRQFRV